MKIRNVKRKPPTHFEQVPVAIVKKIVDAQAPPKKTAGTDNVTVERASGKTHPYSMPWLSATTRTLILR